MAKVVRWTRNNDRQEIHTDDPEEVQRLERETFDDSANIARVDVTWD